jgi:hypothetical protein
MEQLGPYGGIFMKFYIGTFCENLSRRLKFHPNLARMKGNLQKDP